MLYLARRDEKPKVKQDKIGKKKRENKIKRSKLFQKEQRTYTRLTLLYRTGHYRFFHLRKGGMEKRSLFR